MKLSRAGFALAGITLFFLAVNLAWVRLDRAIPPWDDSHYLTNSLVLYDAQTERGLPGFAKQFLKGMGTRPPLLAALPLPIYALVGRTYRAVYAVNLLFLAMLFAVLYRMGKRYASARAGLLAVWIAGTMPIVYGLTRSFLVECGLIALVSVTICLTAEWEETSGAGLAFCIGLACGFGLLMKASFPAYVALPLLYLAVTQRVSVMRLKPLLAFAGAATLVAGPWYAINARHAIGTLLKAGSAETADIYGTGAIFSLAAIGNYWHTVVNAGPALYFAALPLLAAGAYFGLGLPAKRGLRLCALWMAPLLFLTLGHYRDIRFAAPLYPALALALAIVADRFLDRLRGKAGFCAGACLAVLLLLPFLSLLQTSFGILGQPLELGGLLLQPPRLSYARCFDRTVGPQEAILADLYRRHKFNGAERKKVLLGTDLLRFNADNFKLTAAQRKLPFDIETTAYLPNHDALLQQLNSSTYFVYKEGGAFEPLFFNTQGENVARLVRESGRFHEILPAWPLGDGGVARVFVNPPRDRFVRAGAFLEAGMDQIPDAQVTFAGQLQLSGISARRTQEGLEVQYRWRCLRRMSRDYWCFTHVLDAGGTILRYLDHALLDGEPPATLWREGDVAIERLVLPLPPGPAGDLRLRIGVYHRGSSGESGERLAVSESSLPLTEERTAVLVNVTPAKQ
ncbi:MAG TPA: glycosyltransferase family 39 protein [Bryobacteraceae bacterium]|nr:glycosyltransferase family 39 protein [Bryobacteraceae bacterium]